MKKKWHQYVGIRAAIIMAAASIIVAGMYIYNSRSELKRSNDTYKDEIRNKDALISSQQQQLSEKDAEIQRLETQLTPFRTLALEKYTGSEQEALEKLAQNLRVVANKTAALEEKLTPRRLSPEQMAVIAERIRPIRGIKVHILLIASDPEARSFKEQVRKALETGGWIIEKDEISIVGAFNGMSLSASQDPPSNAIKALYLGLQQAGFKAELYKDGKLAHDTIRIKIGKKN